MAKKSIQSESSQSLKLKPISRMSVKLRIVGTSPIIQHKWSEKALREIREKHAGKKTKSREIRNPEAEGQAAMYVTDKGKPGIPAMALKTSIINAAHKDIGIEKTLVRKALFLRVSDGNMVVPFAECSEPYIREDYVRVGQGSTDLRYRPQFDRWAVDIEFELDAELLQLDDLLNLVDRAGFGVGICEWRPEKGGEFGRFQVDRSKRINTKGI